MEASKQRDRILPKSLNLFFIDKMFLSAKY